jgi:hypothetical protein
MNSFKRFVQTDLDPKNSEQILENCVNSWELWEHRLSVLSRSETEAVFWVCDPNSAYMLTPDSTNFATKRTR